MSQIFLRFISILFIFGLIGVTLVLPNNLKGEENLRSRPFGHDLKNGNYVEKEKREHVKSIAKIDIELPDDVPELKR